MGASFDQEKFENRNEAVEYAEQMLQEYKNVTIKKEDGSYCVSYMGEY